MAKYFKSLFQSSEKKMAVYDGDIEDGADPPMDSRRKLSISRSGRMRQANKKRHSLTMELYGEEYPKVEKPKSVEYHVNNPIKEKTDSIDRRRSAGAKIGEKDKHTPVHIGPDLDFRRPSTDTRILETEIDDAFDIIDKTICSDDVI